MKNLKKILAGLLIFLPLVSNAAFTVPQGGTGLGSVTSSNIIYGNGTSPLSTSSNFTYDGTKQTITQPTTPLGTELVTNGSFTGSASGWTAGTGWAYGTNKETFTPPTSGAPLTISIINAGTAYTVGDFLQLDGGSGTCYLYVDTVGGGGNITAVLLDDPGNEGSGYAIGATYPVIGGTGSGATIRVDSISAGNAVLSQTFTLTKTYYYTVSINMTGGTLGTVNVQLGSLGSTHTYSANSGVKSFTEQFVGNYGDGIYITPSSTFNGSVTAISVKRLPIDLFDIYNTAGTELLHTGLDGTNIGNQLTINGAYDPSSGGNNYAFNPLQTWQTNGSVKAQLDTQGHLAIGGVSPFSNAQLYITGNSANFIFDALFNNTFYWSELGLSFAPIYDTPHRNVYRAGGSNSFTSQSSNNNNGGSNLFTSGNAYEGGVGGSNLISAGYSQWKAGDNILTGQIGDQFGSNILLQPSGNGSNTQTNVVFTFNLNDGGIDYTLGDILTLTGGSSNATFKVIEVSGGTISTLRCISGGDGYSVGSGQTLSGGSGTGALIDVTEVRDATVGHVKIYDPTSNFYGQLDTSLLSANRTYKFPDTTGTLFILPSLTTGSVLFSNGTTIAQDNVNFNYTSSSQILQVGSVSTGGQAIIKIKGGVLGGATLVDNFLNITGTLPTVLTGNVRAINIQLTTAGSSSFTTTGARVALASGYTGSSQTNTWQTVNNVAGTATSAWNFGAANYASTNNTNGTTTGNNVGSLSNALGSSSLNMGAGGYATSGTNSPTLNVGIVGMALNATTNIAGVFILGNSAPTLGTSAAILGDNGATGSNILDLRINGTPTFTVGGAGHVLVEGVTSTGAIGTGKFVFDTAPTFQTSINGAYLTANRALVTDASKNIITSATTDTELGYVSGVTSAIQTQLNTKTGSVGTPINLTAQTAAITATTLCTPASTGMYRLSIYLQVTTPGSVSSILGGATGVVLTYNDGDGNVAQTDTVGLTAPNGTVVTTLNTNTTATNLSGSLEVYAKTGVVIQYAIGYTSVGTAMQYAAHLRCEAL